MARNWTAVLVLPSSEGCMTWPPAAIAPRRPMITSSRPTMSTTIHAEARPTWTSAISTPETSSLSAVVSRNEPSVVVTAQRRGRASSREAGTPATANTAHARPSASGPRPSPITTGTSAMRRQVPAARKRTRPLPRRVAVEVATGRPMLPPKRGAEGTRGRGVVGLERLGRRPAGVVERDGPQRGLDLRNAAGGHAQLGDAEAGQQDGGVGVAGQLPAHADPAPVRASALDDGRDQPQHGRRGGVQQPGGALVAALGGQRVLREVVCTDAEEVDLAGEALGLRRDRRHLDHDPHLELRRGVELGEQRA